MRRKWTRAGALFLGHDPEELKNVAASLSPADRQQQEQVTGAKSEVLRSEKKAWSRAAPGLRAWKN